MTKVKPGSIILFHNAALHTPEALPGIIEGLQKQGYTIMPISQLIYKDNYTIDVAGSSTAIQQPQRGKIPPSRPQSPRPTRIEII